MKGGQGGSKTSKTSKSWEEKRPPGITGNGLAFFSGSAVDVARGQGLFYIMTLWDGFG